MFEQKTHKQHILQPKMRIKFDKEAPRKRK